MKVMRNYRPFETLFLVCPKSELAGYVAKSDREKFSRPVRVNVLFVKPNGLAYVRERDTGRFYPVEPSKLKRQYELSTKEVKGISHA